MIQLTSTHKKLTPSFYIYKNILSGWRKALYAKAIGLFPIRPDW